MEILAVFSDIESGRQAGYWLGMAAGAVVFFLGFRASFRSLAKPKANRLGAVAMMVFFAAWSVHLAHLVATRLGHPAWPVGAGLLLVMLLLCLGGLITGLVAIGLHDRQAHASGFLPAILAMGFCLLLGARATGQLTMAIHQASTRGAPATIVENPPPAPENPAPVPPQEAAPAPRENDGNESGREFASAKHFYRLILPTAWKDYTGIGSRLGTDGVSLHCFRTWPAVHFAIIGEGLPAGCDPDSYLEKVNTNLKEAGEILDQDRSRVTLNGLAFQRLCSRVNLTAEKTNLRYEHWVLVQDRNAWQLVFWSGGLAPQRLAKEARAIVDTFRIHPGGKIIGAVGDVSRPGDGFHLDWAGDLWVEMDDKEGLTPLARLAAERSDEALLVVPLRFSDAAPPLDALAPALLSTLDFGTPATAGLTTTDWQPGGDWEGREFAAEREVGNHLSFRYLLRVVRSEKAAWLLAGWAAKESGDLGLVRRTLDRIRLSLPVGEPDPPDAKSTRAMALFWNQVGLAHFRSDNFAEAARAFRLAFETGGEQDPVILENFGHALEKADQVAEARAYLEPRVEKFPKHHDSGLRLARLRVLDGDAAGGAKLFASVCDRGMDNEDELLSWLTFLTQNDQNAHAIDAGRAWVAARPGLNPRRWLAQTLAIAGRNDEATAAYQSILKENPDNVRIIHDLSSHHNDIGQFAEAAALANRLIDDGQATARTHMVLGQSQLGRKWYQDAKASFEKAAALDPGDADIQDSIRQVSALLGQGNNSAIKTPLVPVPLPPAVTAHLADLRLPAGFGDGHSAVWLHQISGWQFNEGKPIRRTVRRKVKVLDAEGADAFSTIEFSFNPLAEMVFMNKVEVRDADGKSVASAKTEDAYVRDEAGEAATHDQVLHLQVPGVRPGCTIEWEITVQDLAPATEFPFERVLLASRFPVGTSIIHLSGEVKSIRSHLTRGESLRFIQGDRYQAWISRPQAASIQEPNAIWPEDRCPFLCLSGGRDDWDQVGRRYLDDIRDRLAIDPSIRDLAATLTKECPTLREKVSALAREVQKPIAYKAIEFGTRARRPNAATETLRLHYGDCKDTSLLLHQLLTAAGIRNHLALVNTDWKLVPDLPSLDQFNHMVLHVPDLGPGFLLDPTNKSLDLARFPADDLWHARAFVLDPAGPHLLDPPAAPSPESCEVAISRTVSLAGDAWRVDESLSLTGYFAAMMRGAFLGRSRDDQHLHAQRILSAQGPARVEEFTFHGLDDPAAPARLHLIYTVPSPMPVIGGATHASLPALWEKDYLATTFVKDRQYDFRLNYPIRLRSRTRLLSPSGLRPDSLSALAGKREAAFANWSLAIEGPASGDSAPVILDFAFDSATGQFPASRYREFHEDWESARTAWDHTISWNPGPVAPPPSPSPEARGQPQADPVNPPGHPGGTVPGDD